MRVRQTRRDFLAGLSTAGAVSALGARASLADEAPLETTTIRLRRDPSVCVVPAYVADDLLRAEGFTESLRVPMFLERHLRPTTDHALTAANINWSDEAMANKTRNQRKRLDALRVAFSYQWEAAPPQSFASLPLRRALRDGGR
jgi:hypothetical protein